MGDSTGREEDPTPAAAGQGPQAPGRGGWNQVAAEEFSLQAVTGGWRGLTESVGPAVVFLVVNSLAGNLRWAVIASLAVAVVFFLARALTRQAPTQAVAGLIGVGICVFFALRTGQARDYFMPGFITNVVYGGVCLLTLIRLPAFTVRGRRQPAGPYPLVGLLVGPLTGEGLRWRAVRDRALRYWWLTLAFAGLFLARLAVQVPLYLADRVEALGVARLVMGVPLFAALIWLCWWVLHGREQHPGAGSSAA